MPPDIHPLPDSVTPYVRPTLRTSVKLTLAQFVYPFVLEPHIITLESSRRQTLAAHTARREAYLKARSDEKERRKRDTLRRIAPGFQPQGTLVPVKVTAGDPTQTDPEPKAERSVMDDLVDQLEALDSK
jgi:hypothetical protein